MHRLHLPLGLLVALLFLFGVASAQAAPADEFTDVTGRVDSWLAGQWDLIQQRETAYYAEHRTYWQGLRTSLTDPKHTDSVDDSKPADNLNSYPTDQPYTWLAIFPEMDGVSIPAVLWIDVYDGPSGPGYIATVSIEYNGVLYSRSLGVGPEAARTSPWLKSEIPVDK